MSNETAVIFRADKSGQFKGTVTAVFPYEPADRHGFSMTCYSHIGQHGGCSREWYDLATRPATPEEYASLKGELEGAPYHYNLKVIKRIRHV